MTTDEAAAPGDGESGPLPFDPSVAHQARMYDYAIVARLLDAVPSGSYLALTHLASDLLDQETRAGLEDLSGRSMRQRITARGREEVARFFAGTDLVDPGIVRPEEWRPDPGSAQTARSSLWSAVGRRR
jgi:hypothetical protein